MSLEGKVALVTGASGGIGRGIAKRLAKDGAAIAIHYGSNEAAAMGTLEAIRSVGGDGKLFQADVSKVADIVRLFKEIGTAFDRLDILVNNAGIAFMKPIAEIEESDFDRIMAINTKGYIFCVREAAKTLDSGGRIVNISSGIAQSDRPGSLLYAASRNAIYNLTRVAAQELGPKGITVNSVSPGPVEPGVFDSLPEPMKARIRAESPFNRVGTPDDIADIVAFLASDGSRWVTGQDILATGGYRP